MPPQVVNFVVIDTTALTTQVMQAANDGAAIQPYNAPITRIVEKGWDYSCYVIIQNNGPDDMVVVSSSDNYGYWAVPPPTSISQGTSATFWLQDYFGPAGSEGYVVYQSASRGQQTFTFQCPTVLSSNACKGGKSFQTRSGTTVNWGPPGQVATSGEPFYVKFQA
jgi:hypothetical protein